MAMFTRRIGHILLAVLASSPTAVEGIWNQNPNQQCSGKGIDYSRLLTIRGLQGEEGLLAGEEESTTELGHWFAKSRIQDVPGFNSDASGGSESASCPSSRVRVREQIEGVPIYGADMVVTMADLDGCETKAERQYEMNNSQTMADMMNDFKIEDVVGKKFSTVADPTSGFQPNLSTAQAKQIIADNYAINVEDIKNEPLLYIYPSTDGDYLSYFLDVLVVSAEDSDIAVYQVVLDAHSGEFINVCTLVDPKERPTSYRERHLLRSPQEEQEPGQDQRELQLSCSSCSTPVTVATYGSEGNCSINSLYLNDTNKTTTCTSATLVDDSIVNMPHTNSALFWNGLSDCQSSTANCTTVAFPSCKDAISDVQYVAIETLSYLKAGVGVLGGIHANAADAQSLQGFVHFGFNYCNAFYFLNQVVFGDCDCSRSSPLVALDVVAHELMHGVTEYSSGLQYSDQSGGLNEGYSDIMGAVMEFVIDDTMDTPDFLVGEALEGTISPLRNMESPTADGESIDSICNFCDGVDVHLSSGILNKAFVKAVRACDAESCLTTIKECVLLLGPLFLYTNIQKLSTLSTFSDAALQTCATVAEFLASPISPPAGTCNQATIQQFVIDGWASVGLTLDSTSCSSVTIPTCQACPTPPPGPSTPPPSPLPSPGPSFCFSEVATVAVKDKGHMQMNKLQVGDRIETVAGYQPIYAFAHREETMYVEYLRLYTEGSHVPLEISAEHLVYLSDQRNPVRADSVCPGDMLRGVSHDFTLSKVDRIYRNGLYAPLTADGTLVVDGIVSSCYVSLQKDATEYIEFQGGVVSLLPQHTIIHMTLTPMRMICMGIGGEICRSSHVDGLIPFVQIGLAFAQFAHTQVMPVQLFMLAFHCMVFGPFFAVECIFGPKLAMIIICGLACLALARKRRLAVLKGEGNKDKVCLTRWGYLRLVS